MRSWVEAAGTVTEPWRSCQAPEVWEASAVMALILATEGVLPVGSEKEAMMMAVPLPGGRSLYLVQAEQEMDSPGATSMGSDWRYERVISSAVMRTEGRLACFS